MTRLMYEKRSNASFISCNIITFLEIPRTEPYNNIVGWKKISLYLNGNVVGSSSLPGTYNDRYL